MSGALRAFGRPRLWLHLWFVLLALALLVSLAPMPEIEVPMAHFDKLEHLVGYAVLAAYAGMLFGTRRARGAGFGAVLALGVAIEGLQALVPWRSAEVLDLLANALGVTIGVAISATPLRHALQWLDTRLSPSP